MSKVEDKANFSRRRKQFDGLTWLTLTPYFTTYIYAVLSTITTRLYVLWKTHARVLQYSRFQKIPQQNLRVLQPTVRMLATCSNNNVPKIRKFNAPCDLEFTFELTFDLSAQTWGYKLRARGDFFANLLNLSRACVLDIIISARAGRTDGCGYIQ